MADSYTTNLNLTKPEVGGSRDTWGTKVNGDLDDIDAVFAAAGTGTSVGLNVGAGKTLKVTGTADLDTAVTINESGADKDFRVEGDTDANLLFTDASTDRVGIGTNTPSAKLDVSGNVAQNAVAVSASAVDCSTGNYFTKTASGALTWTFTNVPASRAFAFALALTNGGAGTQTWPAAVVWNSGTAPTLQTSGTDILVFITSDGGTTWRGVRAWKQA